MTSKRTILVTSALPYANNSLHIGHVLEYVQTDVWVRFQRMRGVRCWYVCASDAHGTPTMLRAEQEGIRPEELIKRVSADHRRDFATFRIRYVPDQSIVELKSIKLYMWAYRNEGAFHEDLTNRVLDDFVATARPRWIEVVGDWNVRGGIKTVVLVTHGKRPEI